MTTLAPELAALLSHCSDCTFPRQAADVSGVSELVVLCSAVQVCAEGSRDWHSAQLGTHARPLLSRLAFFLAAFPGADNVVASICILCYLVALTPEGPLAIAHTLMPAELLGEESVLQAAAASLGQQRTQPLPRSRLLLPRLLYSVQRTAGRVYPANGMLSCARAATLCRLLAEELERHSIVSQAAAAAAAAAGSGAATAYRAPEKVLLLRQLLLNPTTLATLTRTAALYATRPGPSDPLITLRASQEAVGALTAIASAGAAGDEACFLPCSSPLRVAAACAEALAGAGGACLTAPAATALLETLRNSFITLPRSLDALFRRLGLFGQGGDSELGGPEGFFLVGGWAQPGEEASWPLGSVELAQEEPHSRAFLTEHCARVLAQCNSTLHCLHKCQWVECPPALPPGAEAAAAAAAASFSSSLPAAAPPTPAIYEHYLCACFNLCASASLRLALTTCLLPAPPTPLGQSLRGMLRVALEALTRHGFVRDAQPLLPPAAEGAAPPPPPPPPPQPPVTALEARHPGSPFHARAVEAALRVLDCPLSGMGLLSGSALAGLFFSSGGGELFCALLGNWVRSCSSSSSSSSGQGGVGPAQLLLLAQLEPLLLRAAAVLAAHLEHPEAVLGQAGCVPALLRGCAAFAAASVAARPCLHMQDARYATLSMLASRAATVPAGAWGGAVRGGGGSGADLPGTEWARAAGDLMECLDDAVEAASQPQLAAGTGLAQHMAASA